METDGCYTTIPNYHPCLSIYHANGSSVIIANGSFYLYQLQVGHHLAFLLATFWHWDMTYYIYSRYEYKWQIICVIYIYMYIYAYGIHWAATTWKSKIFSQDIIIPVVVFQASRFVVKGWNSQFSWGELVIIPNHLKFNSKNPWKVTLRPQKRKGVSPKHHFSGANC